MGIIHTPHNAGYDLPVRPRPEPISCPVEEEKAPRKTRVSKSTKAGLVFPVTGISERLKREKHARRVAQSASVYLAAVLEYLTYELLELAGVVAKASKKARINPRDILLAVKGEHGDREFSELLGKSTIIADGGAVPYIHPKLWPTPATNTQRRATIKPRVKYRSLSSL